MASVLRRFRRLAPPGGAMAGIAPPVDTEAARASELASVFATIDDVRREVDSVIDAARLEADAIRSSAAADAASTVARAREQAAVEKARASERRLGESIAERDALMAAATREVAAITTGEETNADAVAQAVTEQLQEYAATGTLSP